MQVNNAGVAMVAPLELCPEAEFAHVMDVNVTGPLRVTQCFLPLLKKSDHARIVNVGSQINSLSHLTKPTGRTPPLPVSSATVYFTALPALLSPAICVGLHESDATEHQTSNTPAL